VPTSHGQYEAINLKAPSKHRPKSDPLDRPMQECLKVSGSRLFIWTTIRRCRCIAEPGLIGNITKLPQMPIPRARRYFPLLVLHACRSLHSATGRIGPAFLFDGYLTLFAIV
jgi:hypothetical protein